MKRDPRLLVPTAALGAATAGLLARHRNNERAHSPALASASSGGGRAAMARTKSGAARNGGGDSKGADGITSVPPEAAGVPGADADKPTEIPAAGWKQILKRAYKEMNDDNMGLLAAGVAFYAFLAIFPALIAAITVYGLVADPSQVQSQIGSVTSALPKDTASVITNQLKSIAGGSSKALSIGLVISILGALFSASGGMQNLMKAVNLAYDEDEERGFVKLRGTAFLLTLGAILFILVAVALVAVLPVVLNAVGLGGVATFLIGAVRWVGLIVVMMVALAILYRYAPSRDNPRFAWTSIGAAAATVLWVIFSVIFSLYVSHFGSYAKTYGAIAGVVVLMLWLYYTCYMVLFGAEINSEMEHQTVKDTTTGEPKPLGERDAVMADSLPTQD